MLSGAQAGWHLLCSDPIMTLSRFLKAVVVASEDEFVIDIARKLRDAKVGCVIVTRDKHPVGIVTDRDIAIRVVAEGLDPSKTHVSEILTYDPCLVRVDDGIETAVARIRKHGVRRLPIVDNQGALIGMVTADDLMILLGREVSGLCEGIDESTDSAESR